jgi:DNA-binding MarR family transcriptional regulator
VYPSLRVEDRSQGVLAFIAEHDVVVLGQVQKLLDGDEDSVQRLLAALVEEGLLRSERLTAGGSIVCRITPKGLESIASELPAPAIQPERFRHALGVVWLWLAARDGVFGEAERVLSHRRMKQLDKARDPASTEVPFGVLVEISGQPPAWRYPDLMLVLRQGRVPVHLELTLRPREELEALLPAYVERSAAVLFMVDDLRVGTHLQAAKAELGLSDFVHVQRVAPNIGS